MFFLKQKKDINQGINEYRQTPNAVLLDVRTKKEVVYGTIPGSVNLPLNNLKKAPSVIKDHDTPVFIYCISGARADKAAKRLRRMGYTNCRSIGGLSGYSGKLKKSILR